MLVVGSLSTSLFQPETRTKKMIQADALIAKGQAIQILNEREFFLTISQRVTSLSNV